MDWSHFATGSLRSQFAILKLEIAICDIKSTCYTSPVLNALIISMPKTKIIVTILVVLTIFTVLTAYAYELPHLFTFNNEKSLNEWQEKVFKNKVLYAV